MTTTQIIIFVFIGISMIISIISFIKAQSGKTGPIGPIGPIGPSGGVNGALPAGSIIIWSGNTIPTGWVLCDGKGNNVPNLINKFVYGADTINFLTTGGSDSYKLTYTAPTLDGSQQGTKCQVTCCGGICVNGTMVYTNNTIKNESGSSALNLLPPYIKLYYIMKT
jgi:hypothetical protein